VEVVDQMEVYGIIFPEWLIEEATKEQERKQASKEDDEELDDCMF